MYLRRARIRVRAQKPSDMLGNDSVQPGGYTLEILALHPQGHEGGGKKPCGYVGEWWAAAFV